MKKEKFDDVNIVNVEYYFIIVYRKRYLRILFCLDEYKLTNEDN